MSAWPGSLESRSSGHPCKDELTHRAMAEKPQGFVLDNSKGIPVGSEQQERKRIGDVVTRLRDVGYPLVMTNYRAGPVRPDVVGFLPTRAGTLLPHAVVELKNFRHPQVRQGERALEQLASYRQALGTRVHYLVTGDGWHRADTGLRTLTEVPGPGEVWDQASYRDFVLDDNSVIRGVLDGELWSRLDAVRGHGGSGLDEVIAVLRAAADGSVSGRLGPNIVFDKDVLWSVVLEWLPTVMTRLERRDLSTPAPITDLMARLCDGFGGAVLDPFCGTGMLLARAGAIAAKSSVLYGRDLDTAMVSVAQELGNLAPNEVEVQRADAFSDPLPAADLVVTAPPFGLRLPEPFDLSNGDKTRDGDLAVIDTCLRALNPGGRLVMLTSKGWLFKTSATRYRQYLAQESHIQALVGLPGGLLRATSIPTTIVVIDKKAPGETFVADMSADWESELAEDGAAWQALRQHLGGRPDVD